jgi:acetyl esterase/lipase
MGTYNLDKPAADMVAYLAQGPNLYEMTPAEARQLLDGAPEDPSPVPELDESWTSVPAEVGDVRVLVIKPPTQAERLPVVLYMHGGGWILGGVKSHGRLARDLAVAAEAAVLFIDYALAPEAQYPVQIEQCYAVAQWVTQQGAYHGLDASRMAVAGDSAGGNMATVLALLAKRRGDVAFVHQSMYYPITDARSGTESYRLFKDGPYGGPEMMAWFWANYLPDNDLKNDITVSPLRANLDDLQGLPPALVIVDENDVLRDEGEAYAERLRQAGVATASVRFNGTMHDFMTLAPLRDTESSRAAIAMAGAAMRRAFASSIAAAVTT